MPYKVAATSLNASTIDILNTIRANASAQYQELVPEITQALDVRKVGESISGYPALANEFIEALINRIAVVAVKASTFNNAYSMLKKGYLSYGEEVMEVFVNIIKAREYSAEKAADRELKRSLPDVRSTMHFVNIRLQYPVTIQDSDLAMAFLSAEGVRDMIAKIIVAVKTSQEYDEFLLFKYCIINAVTKGEAFPVLVDTDNVNTIASAFRGMSNKLTFLSNEYNAKRVHVSTPKNEQYLFMSADADAQFDVEVLASAFNMDKAEFFGHRLIIDNWDTFDNDRFEQIRAASDGMPAITDEQLALMKDVVGVLVDGEFFQFYDKEMKWSQTYVASGLYWNYFLNAWKVISTSPFSNVVVFVKDTTQGATMPQTFTANIVSKSVGDAGTVLVVEPQIAEPDFVGGKFEFIQGHDSTAAGVGVKKYGAILFPANSNAAFKLRCSVDGTLYQASTNISTENKPGDSLSFALLTE